MLVAIALVVGSISVSAQLLIENFEYTAAALLNANGWSAHSGAGTNSEAVSTSSITYPGYAGSGVGNEVTLAASGEDVNKAFTNQSSGSVYAAYLVNITTASTNGDYFAHFAQTSGTTVTVFGGRLWAKKDANNNLAFGISKSSTAANLSYTGFNYSLGVTYLIVVKYNFITGATNDTGDLFINPTIGAAEPTPTISTLTADNGAADLTGITSICLRQGTAGNTTTLKIDGIRVGTAWADVCTAPASTPKVEAPTFSATPGNVISAQSVSLTSNTAGASIYYTTDGVTVPNNTGSGTLYDGTPIAVSATTTIKAIGYKTGYDPSSVATAVYNFPTEVANIAALRATSQSGFYKLTGQTLLTYQNSVGKVKFIQDGTAGIVIYDATSKITSTYAIGDNLPSIYCTLSMFNGMLELIPFTDPGAAASSGNAVTPTVVRLTNIGSYVGQLVIVKNVAITGTGNFASATAYVINDGTAGVLRTAYSDLPYIGSAIPTTKLDITGVVNMYSVSEADLIPRSITDFVVSPPTITVTEVEPIPTMSTSAGNTTTQTINVSGVNLTDVNGIGMAITGTNAGLFTLSINNVPQTGGTAANTVVTITYSPITEGSHSATLTLTSAGATNVTRTLNGTASPATGLNNPRTSLVVSTLNGNILLTATAGELVEVFNAIGQKLVSKLTVDGLNMIPVTAQGVVIVKVDNRIAKVIL